jgi:DNA polymerase-3 subunit chi
LPLDIGFYHCTRAPAAEVAVRLCARALEGGQRLLVIGAPDRLAALDMALWTHMPDSFLAHGMAGGANDAEQPILLSETAEAMNGARLLLSLEAGIPGGMDGFDRVLNLFEDGTPAHERARKDWKALSAREGLTRSYWHQTERGGWEKRG